LQDYKEDYLIIFSIKLISSLLEVQNYTRNFKPDVVRELRFAALLLKIAVIAGIQR
jgi:hypothetical protein